MSKWRIIKIYVSDYRSIKKEVSISLEDDYHTFPIIGKNGIGRSNLINVILRTLGLWLPQNFDNKYIINLINNNIANDFHLNKLNEILLNNPKLSMEYQNHTQSILNPELDEKNFLFNCFWNDFRPLQFFVDDINLLTDNKKYGINIRFEISNGKENFFLHRYHGKKFNHNHLPNDISQIYSFASNHKVEENELQTVMYLYSIDKKIDLDKVLGDFLFKSLKDIKKNLSVSFYSSIFFELNSIIEYIKNNDDKISKSPKILTTFLNIEQEEFKLIKTIFLIVKLMIKSIDINKVGIKDTYHLCLEEDFFKSDEKLDEAIFLKNTLFTNENWLSIVLKIKKIDLLTFCKAIWYSNFDKNWKNEKLKIEEKISSLFFDYSEQENILFEFVYDKNKQELGILITDQDTTLRVSPSAKSAGFIHYVSTKIMRYFDRKSTIYFLDEPGLAYPPTMQKQLLKFFEGLKGKVIYATHFSLLINKTNSSIIGLEKRSINQGITLIQGTYKDRENRFITIFTDLGMDELAKEFDNMKGNFKYFLILEGETDKKYFDILFNLLSIENIFTYPIYGVDKLTINNRILSAIKVANFYNAPINAIFDYDDAGVLGKKIADSNNIKAFFYSNLMTTKERVNLSKIEIEDFLEPLLKELLPNEYQTYNEIKQFINYLKKDSKQINIANKQALIESKIALVECFSIKHRIDPNLIVNAKYFLKIKDKISQLVSFLK